MAFSSLAFVVFDRLLSSRIMVLWAVILLCAVGAMFVHDQRVLARIIGRAKEKKLTEIRTRIEQLEREYSIEDQEIIGTINELYGYYDRVKGAPNAALNFRTGLNLVNSLLLSVLGILARNLGDWLPSLLR